MTKALKMVVEMLGGINKFLDLLTNFEAVYTLIIGSSISMKMVKILIIKLKIIIDPLIYSLLLRNNMY